MTGLAKAALNEPMINRVRIRKDRRGDLAIVEVCCICGGRHVHGAPKSGPLGNRVAHCGPPFRSSDIPTYNLVETMPHEPDERTILDGEIRSFFAAHDMSHPGTWLYPFERDDFKGHPVFDRDGNLVEIHATRPMWARDGKVFPGHHLVWRVNGNHEAPPRAPIVDERQHDEVFDLLQFTPERLALLKASGPNSTAAERERYGHLAELLWRYAERETPRVLAGLPPAAPPTLEPEPTSPPPSAAAPPPVTHDSPLPVIYRRLSDVQAQLIRWLWPGRIARGKVSLLAGHPGLGKSQVAVSLAAIVTTGGMFPVDGGRCEHGSVVILSAEDDAADTIKPRLLAAGADTSRCYTLDAVPDTDLDGSPFTRSFNLRTDLDRLAALLEAIGDAILVIVDPITAYLGATDSHRNAEVRGVLAPLADLAARYSVAVAAVSHLNKAGDNEALLRVTGSLAFVAAARAAYIITRDKDNPVRRLFLPLKNNLGNDQAGLAFIVEARELDGGIQTSRVAWESEPVTVTADEAMQPAEPDEERSQRDEIADWLQDLLGSGRMKSQEVQTKAKQAGFAWRTVQRAAREAGVAIKREGFGPETVTYWSLR